MTTTQVMGWKRETLVAPKGLKRLALKTPDARFDHYRVLTSV